MYSKPIHGIDDITFDDRAVGILALITMYQVVIFLLLQVPIIIISSIFLMLGENGTLNGTTASTISAGIAILLELTLVVVLSLRGKKAFLEQIVAAQAREHDNSDKESYSPPAFTETQLEIMIALAACIAIAWSMLIGVGSLGMKVLLGIIEGFAFIFLITFMTVRFLTTREIRRTAVYCLLLTALSLWLVTGGTIP